MVHANFNGSFSPLYPVGDKHDRAIPSLMFHENAFGINMETQGEYQ